MKELSEWSISELCSQIPIKDKQSKLKASWAKSADRSGHDLTQPTVLFNILCYESPLNNLEI